MAMGASRLQRLELQYGNIGPELRSFLSEPGRNAPYKTSHIKVLQFIFWKYNITVASNQNHLVFNLQKMTNVDRFVLTTGILFGINLVSFPCKGKIILPPEGNTFVVPSGTDLKIAWTFDNEICTVGARQWSVLGDGGLLAQIILDGDVDIQSPGQLLGVNVTRNGTLILKNVDQQHNGKYRFQITLAGNVKQSSVVTVFVGVNSNLTINCTRPSTLIISDDVTGTLTVNKSDDVRCLCKDVTGNPPTNVTWYKNGVQHGVPRIKENMLSLSRVVGGDSGTYKCEAQSYILKDGKSVKVTVDFAPENISLTTSPEKAELNKSLIITCNADGHPEPTYKIIYNNSNTVSTNKTYIDWIISMHCKE